MPSGHHRKDLSERTCPECLVRFTPVQSNQKYHASSCRLKAHQRRRFLGEDEAERMDTLVTTLLRRLDRFEAKLDRLTLAHLAAAGDLRASAVVLDDERFRELVDTMESDG